MARYEECDCVGCPQGCIRCGREKPYTVYECDWCGYATSDEWEKDKFEEVGKYEVCGDCYGRYLDDELDENGNEVEDDVQD